MIPLTREAHSPLGESVGPHKLCRVGQPKQGLKIKTNSPGYLSIPEGLTSAMSDYRASIQERFYSLGGQNFFLRKYRWK